MDTIGALHRSLTNDPLTSTTNSAHRATTSNRKALAAGLPTVIRQTRGYPMVPLRKLTASPNRSIFLDHSGRSVSHMGSPSASIRVAHRRDSHRSTNPYHNASVRVQAPPCKTIHTDRNQWPLCLDLSSMRQVQVTCRLRIHSGSSLI